MYKPIDPKPDFPKLEEEILKFWEDNKIFEKSLEQNAKGEAFTFYDGPPFATGLPHYGHILASTIKDVIPRFQTMKGKFVRRRWGWDCHGLPIEEVVERKLGISGKKQIEEMGIGKFNETCRSMVLQYANQWREMVRRMARWIEFDNSYKTMDRDYMESVWWAFKEFYNKGLVYEGRKVLLYCPRCETPVSNFEVAMDNSYKTLKEEAVTVKFKLKPNQQWKFRKGEIPNDTFFLAWTTTPWTLPGNVALAIGKDIEYVIIKYNNKRYILAEKLVSKHFPSHDFSKLDSWEGIPTADDIIGLEYEPLFDVPAVSSEKAFKVYPADFVTTEDGTGIVHTAVVYGEEDYELGIKVGLPIVPLLDEKGKFNDKSPELIQGMYFKDSEDVIKKDLEDRGLMFSRHFYTHEYPHCWRCGNGLFYNAIPAWFINIQKIRPDLIKSNKNEIEWYPKHLKHGRYEKSVEAAPDWNISRNRYWGNPIPVWKCEDCGENKVVGSIKELGLSKNTLYFTRHAEARQNLLKINSNHPEKEVYDLTEKGVKDAEKLAHNLGQKGGVDLIFSSDLLRTKRTAEIVGKALGAEVLYDERLREYNMGEFNNRPYSELAKGLPSHKRWENAPLGGETWTEVQKRILDCVLDINKKYEGKRILLISHGDPLWLLARVFGSNENYPEYAKVFELDVSILDVHRPYIDEVVLKCDKCPGNAKRVTEIFDSWVEAASMPFAEFHYPFSNKEQFESRFPAQFVAEYIAQTRAWFYVMHVVSLVLFGKAPFENVVTTGTILAEDGSKMSKSKGNFPDPWKTITDYGADSLRLYLMNSTVMQADNLNFSLKELTQVYRKVLLILWNIYNYFVTYANQEGFAGDSVPRLDNVMDQWISVRNKQLVNEVTGHLEAYDTVRATRAVEKYLDDLSTWYLRRSRGRKDAGFFSTLRSSLVLASRVLAPFTPYISEEIFKNLESKEAESVHLSSWPQKEEVSKQDLELLRQMETVREAVTVGLAARKELKLPVRQPLPKLAVGTKEGINLSSELVEILLSELNIKEEDKKLIDKAREDSKIFGNRGIMHVDYLYLDTTLTPKLKLEGMVRGVERIVQDARKKAGYKVGETAILFYDTNDALLNEAVPLIDRKKTFLAAVNKSAENLDQEAEIEGKKLRLGIFRHEL
jgi:isoleucyl-tRNA synthetase